jgi:hypothetical protein
MKTSSRRVQFWMAESMEGVGVVTTSPGGVNSVCVKVKFGTRLAAEVESSWTRTGPGILRAVRPVYGFEVCCAIEAF